jgi:hypothetical protein
VAEASADLEFTLRTADPAGLVAEEVAVEVDGADVAAECAVRLPRLHPVNRGDWRYRPPGGWPPGLHEVTVSWPGRLDAETWTFEVED